MRRKNTKPSFKHHKQPKWLTFNKLFIAFTFVVLIIIIIVTGNQLWPNNILGSNLHYAKIHYEYIQNTSTTTSFERIDLSLVYTWLCKNLKCIKTLVDVSTPNISLETCSMTCDLPPLWPKPHTLRLYKSNSTLISIDSIHVGYYSDTRVYNLLKNGANVFLKNLEAKIKPNNPFFKNNEIKQNLSIDITVTNGNSDLQLQLTTDESYNLEILYNENLINVKIKAKSYFGARHGLETLLQLIWYDNYEQSLRILYNIHIQDSPIFAYRGLMVDTARNFFPVEVLEKTIDGMASVKLNVLHLHLTDSVSFPISLPSLPLFAYYGAYSTQMVYTSDHIKKLIRYARIRGVRLILEIDAPSHVYEGWNHYNDEMFIKCHDARDGPNGQINPNSKKALDTLEQIYKDILQLTGDKDIFHIGGDELLIDCWQKHLALEHVEDVKHVWFNYTKQMIQKLKSANNNTLPKNVVLWSSKLTDAYPLNSLDENIILQHWLGDQQTLIQNNNKVIFSSVDYLYLDCGFGPWNPSKFQSNCKYSPWHNIYNFRPWNGFTTKDFTLGAEACLWTEQVDVDTIETRIWPRTAALAERLWTDPTHGANIDVYHRIDIQRGRFSEINIKSQAIWPKWCSQNPKTCGYVYL